MRAADVSLHTSAILKVPLAGGVSCSVLYSSALCRPIVTPDHQKQADSSFSESSAFLLKLELIEKKKKMQENTKRDNIQAMPSLAPEYID